MKKSICITLIFFAGFLCTKSLFSGDNKKLLPLIPAKNIPVTQQAPATQKLVSVKPVLLPAQNSYSYNPAGKPDPFRPFIEEEIAAKKEAEIAAKKKAEKKKILSIFPLQRIETGQFKLVGIAGNQTHRIAMVEDTSKKFYPLSIGTHIGMNNGKIVEILPDCVVIEEHIGKKAKKIILKLRKN